MANGSDAHRSISFHPSFPPFLSRHWPGANATLEESNGWTPFHVAASLEDTGPLEALLECAVDADGVLLGSSVRGKESVLEVAIRERRQSAAVLLVQRGACLPPEVAPHSF